MWLNVYDVLNSRKTPVFPGGHIGIFMTQKVRFFSLEFLNTSAEVVL
jgi:hypothetical protein